VGAGGGGAGGATLPPGVGAGGGGAGGATLPPSVGAGSIGGSPWGIGRLALGAIGGGGAGGATLGVGWGTGMFFRSSMVKGAVAGCGIGVEMVAKPKGAAEASVDSDAGGVTSLPLGPSWVHDCTV